MLQSEKEQKLYSSFNRTGTANRAMRVTAKFEIPHSKNQN
jgi:hypothetical protein